MVHRVAYYHHPLDKQFSLDFVNDDAATFAEEYAQYDPVRRKAIGYPFPDATAYCLYTNTGSSGTTDDLVTTQEEMTTAVSQMDSATERSIVIRLLGIYDEVRQEEQDDSGDEGLEIYKEIEVDRIPEAFNEVDWSGTATEVAGRLMSNLILKHALPNANHRSAISMLEVYLDFCTFGRDVGFSMPSTHTPEYEWRDWVDQYIRLSKRILTVRRNNVRFKMLQEMGCSTVIRKGGIEIELDEWELDMYPRDAMGRYARFHEQHCIGFAEEVVARADSLELVSQDALTQPEFAELLSIHA